jgi:hypothetical protein
VHVFVENHQCAGRLNPLLGVRRQNLSRKTIRKA